MMNSPTVIYRQYGSSLRKRIEGGWQAVALVSLLTFCVISVICLGRYEDLVRAKYRE